MPGYDEDRSSVHTDLETAAKESQDKAIERYNELQANVAVDLSDAAQIRGRAYGYGGAAIVDPGIREAINALGEDPNATGAVVSPRQTESGEWEVDESKLGGEGSGPSETTQARRKSSSRKAASSSESSASS